MGLKKFKYYSFKWEFDKLSYKEKRYCDPYEFILKSYGLAWNAKKNIFESCFISITGFTPYVYINLPDHDSKGSKINWNRANLASAKFYIEEKLHGLALADIEHVRRKTMKRYSKDSHNYFKVSLTTQDQISDIKFRFQKKVTQKLDKIDIFKMTRDELHDLIDILPEDDHPLLYSVAQRCKGIVGEENEESFLEDAQDLQKAVTEATGFKSGKKITVNEHRISSISSNLLKFEVHEDWISPIIKFMASTGNCPTGWKKIKGTRIKGKGKCSTCKHEYEVEWNNIHPTNLDVPVKPSICSLDIETYSSRYKQASSGVSAAPDPYRVNDDVWMISLRFFKVGDTDSINYVITTRNCNPDKHPNSIVIQVPKEVDLLMKTKELIMRKDPDILLGHNILGYDLGYMAKRAGYDDGVIKKTRYEKKQKQQTLFHNAVWSEFSEMGRLKDTPSPMVKNEWSSGAYKGMNFEYMDIPGRLIIDTFPYCKRSYASLESHKLDYLALRFLKENKVPVSYYEMWEIADRNIAEEVDRVIDYIEVDTLLPQKLFDKLNIWTDLNEQSKVCNLPIFDLYTRGQSIRGLAQIYKRTCTLGYVLDLPEPEPDEYDDDGNVIVPEKYQGAYVHDPIPGLYHNVLCVDFAGLYPSMIRAYNLDYTTFVEDPDIPDDMCHVIEWTDKKNGKYYYFRFIKQEYHRGLLPQALDDMTLARANTNAEKKQHKHPELDIALEGHESEYATLDARQKSIKESMNSTYGLTGFRKGRLGNMPAAMCTTAKGRESIEKVMAYLVEHYNAEIVYGDTDSAMFRVDKWDYTQSYDNGPKIAAEISAIFPPPMKLEFEKIFRIYIILKKKMYAGRIYNRDMTKLIYFMKKGLITQRRDYCKYAKDTYAVLLEMLTDEKSTYEDIEAYIIERVKYLMSGQVPLDDLKLRKTYNPPYKVRQAHAVLAEEMKSQGHDVQAGDIIYYVFIEKPGAKQVYQRVQDPVLYKKNNQKLDLPFYLEKQMTTRIIDLLDVVYPKIKITLEHMAYAYKYNKLTRHVSIVAPYAEKDLPYIVGYTPQQPQRMVTDQNEKSEYLIVTGSKDKHCKQIQGYLWKRYKDVYHSPPKESLTDTITIYNPSQHLLKNILHTVWIKQIVTSHLNLLFKRTGYCQDN